MNSVFFGAGQAVDPNKYVPLTFAEAQGTVNTTTSSTTYVPLANMIITPLEGTHIVNFSCSAENTGAGIFSTPTETLFSLFVDGVQVVHTERVSTSGEDDNFTVAINGLVTVDGTQNVEIRWRVVSGTATALRRTMTILKVADLDV